MSDQLTVERAGLEKKDRSELQAIVAALGGSASSRARKAELIDQILELSGAALPAGDDIDDIDDSPDGAEGSTEVADPAAGSDDASETDASPDDEAASAGEDHATDTDTPTPTPTQPMAMAMATAIPATVTPSDPTASPWPTGRSR